ncbi:hypothetical protein EGR_00955 [Echinococcus granulosus]|uniref:Uncharacterized protein n=1 Tax=Echinococcus granulosus TaxID=6210 RepID=W6UUS7_ECHGR|nr:hypothetical protein EGR_00955 [Echinococcus granulosus]EUB64411.1 hypothetical protein EGR_00955 [Echinococcus granulosus]
MCCQWRTFKDNYSQFNERSLTRPMSANPSLIPIPRLNIPSESVSTTSSVSDDAPPIAVKKDVEDTVAVDEKEAEVETCGFNLQALNAEQTSLSWTCDAFSKESDHMGTGWMIEYSKTVAAANLVRDKKGILEARQKFPSKHISALDVELARILHTHEAETQRMASPFIT